jgi:hypothetical protein
VADMAQGIQGGRGTNWLLIWIVIALVVGILLIVAVTIDGGYHTSSEIPGAAGVVGAVGALS